MQRSERAFLYSAVGLSLLLGLRAATGPWGNAGDSGVAFAASPAALAADVDPAKLATCDMYDLTDRLVQSETYIPARTAEEARLRGVIEPLEKELTDLQKAIETAVPPPAPGTPPDPAAPPTMDDATKQIKIQEFQAKREAYMRQRQQLSSDFSLFVSKQYIAAYEVVRTTTATIAKSKGFSHVLASRELGKEIETTDPQQLIMSMLSRPVIVAPEGADITAFVRTELKLDSPVPIPPAVIPTPAVPPKTP